MLQSFLEKSGLDWLPILVNEKGFFPFSQPPYTDEECAEFERRIREIDEESLPYTISNLKDRFEEEEKRRSTIEAKATTLQGFAALAATFIVGFAQFLIGDSTLTSCLKVVIAILYFCIALSLLMTVALAQRAVKTAQYSRPQLTDWLALRDWNRLVISRQHASNLLKSIQNNIARNNDKGTYLNGAQDWFRNSIYLLLVFALLLFTTVVTAPSKQARQSDQPINVIVLTPTLDMMSTAVPTFTPQQTDTPVLPTIMPVVTRTATPTVTLTPIP
jgi:hypothetical protein